MELLPSIDLAPGAVFAGRYAVEGLLGRGGMGAVYRASDIALGEPIALKVLLVDEKAAATSVLRFRQEVRLARRVTHPNVARVFDLGEHGAVVFMTMELIDGLTLRQRINEVGRLTAAAGLAVIHALAEGIAAAHAVGVLHRDLKPSNVMIEKRGRVVITDFGIARAVDEPTDLTVGAIGTPSYMAPEQLAGSPATERTDAYQLGVVAHEVLVGSLSKRGAAVAEKDLLAAAVPRAAAVLIARCLETDAQKRPASLAAMALELADMLKGLASATTTVHAPTEPACPPSVDAATVMGPTPRRSSPSSTGSGPVRSLAVMPFRARGIDIELVGEAFMDEVLDQLSRTRGLRVFAAAATREFKADADPRAVAQALGAELVVLGSLTRDADLLKFNVRLVDRAGVQLWSDRFETGVTAMIAAAETIARRVAETLRVEIQVRAGACPLSEEAASAYFEARRRLRVPEPAAVVEARDCFARCLETEPGFLPAYAGHATASLRCWFMLDDPDGELARSAEWSVERAASLAPEAAETHLAGAIHAVHHGAYPAAVRELERALAIAPMYADAHEYFGMLECEAARSEDAFRHLERALELDPTLINARLCLVRERAIAGDYDGAEAILVEIERRAPSAVGYREVRLRLAMWRRDHETLARLVRVGPISPMFEFVRVCAEVALGRRPPNAARVSAGPYLSHRTNPRFVALAAQLIAEASASIGDDVLALAAVDDAIRASLIDYRWLARCPLLEPLRADGRLDAALHLVGARAAALFR